MWLRVITLAVMAALLLAPGAAAERAGGLPMPDSNVLYIHYTEADEQYFLSNVKDEPDQYIGGRGTGTTCVESPVCVPSTDAMSWSFPLDPPVADIYLDSGATVHMEAWIGSTSKSGRVDATAELRLDGDVIASGDTVTNTYNAEYVEFSWDEALSVDTIPAGSQLEWYVEAQGAHTGIFIRMADAPGWSHIVLPITGNGELPEPDVTVNQTTHQGILDEAGIDLSFSNATSDSYLYNWTVEEGAWTIDHNITVAAGNATIALSDDNGTALFETAIAEDTAGTSPALDMQPGEYQVRLVFDGFVGNASIQVAPAETGSLDDATDDETTEDDSTGNETLDGAGGDDKGSPGIGPVGLVGAIGAIALLRRRA